MLDIIGFFGGNFTCHLCALRGIRPIVRGGRASTRRRLIEMLARRVVGSLAPVVSLTSALYRKIRRSALRRSSLLVTLRTVGQEDGNLLRFIRGCHGLRHVSGPRFRSMEVNSLITSLRRLCPSSVFRCRVRGRSRELLVSHSRVRRILVGLLGGTRRTIRGQIGSRTRSTRGRVPCIHLAARLSDGGHSFVVSVASGNGKVLPRMVRHVFIPFFAAGADNSNVKLDVYGRVMALRNKAVATSSGPNSGAAFDIILPT